MIGALVYVFRQFTILKVNFKLLQSIFQWKDHDVLINLIYYKIVYVSTTTLLLKVIT